MTLVIMPWNITDYDGTGIITCGMDHIGFKVAITRGLQKDVAPIADDNPLLAPAPVGTGAEGGALDEADPSGLARWASITDRGLRRRADR